MIPEVRTDAPTPYAQLYNTLPLNGPRLQIRLLTILPAAWPDTLRCRLSRTVLVQSKPYEALSYAWGGTVPDRYVVVNGCRVAVMRNLENALRRLRRHDRPRLVWVDALCINQQDPDERTSQVNEMGNIYSYAHRVLIWLGDSNYEEDFALRYIAQIMSSPACQVDLQHSVTRQKSETVFKSAEHDLRVLERWRKTTINLGYKFAYGRFDPASRADEIELHVAQSRVLLGLTNLFGKPWFTRVWVAQELARASASPLVMCGATSIPWSVLVRYATEYPDSVPEDGRNAVATLDVIRTRVRLPPRLRDLQDILPSSEDVFFDLCRDLFFLMNATRDFQASDPRDRVFALWTLVRAPHDHPLVPTYSKSISQVSREVMSFIMQGIQGLRLLGLKWPLESTFSRDNPLEQRSVVVDDETFFSFPSWVPNFSLKPRPALPLSRSVTEFAETWIQMPPLLESSPDEDYRVLRTPGKAVDRVDAVHELPYEGCKCFVERWSWAKSCVLTQRRLDEQSYRKRFAALQDIMDEERGESIHEFDNKSSVQALDLGERRDQREALLLDALCQFGMARAQYRCSVRRSVSTWMSQTIPNNERPSASLHAAARRWVACICEEDPLPMDVEWDVLSPALEHLKLDTKRQQSCFPAELAKTLSRGGMVVFDTLGGYRGISPRGIRVGDELVLLRGADFISVLRSTEPLYDGRETTHTLFGTIFLDVALGHDRRHGFGSRLELGEAAPYTIV